MSDKEIDQPTGVETTGHEWDGIKELNNPLAALVADYSLDNGRVVRSVYWILDAILAGYYGLLRRAFERSHGTRKC